MQYDPDKVLTAIATVLVGLPALVPTLMRPEDVTPQITFVVALLALIGGAILKQSKPIGGGLSDEDRRAIAKEQEEQRRNRVNLVRASRKRPVPRD